MGEKILQFPTPHPDFNKDTHLFVCIEIVINSLTVMKGKMNPSLPYFSCALEVDIEFPSLPVRIEFPSLPVRELS